MSKNHLDAAAVLAELKDFQRRTADWTFQQMFADKDPALRFLVADEVGLGKTHVAKGVIAQVIDYLGREGDRRHDIVYVCSNAAIARQNLRKLLPKGIEPIDSIERLTMLPLAQLDNGSSDQPGINLLAITPGTSLKFGRNTGLFKERCLAYTFLRECWGRDVMDTRAARWIFWKGLAADNADKRRQADKRLRDYAGRYCSQIGNSLPEFKRLLGKVDERRRRQEKPTVRELFDEIVAGLARKRSFPADLISKREDLIVEVRQIMATVGITALRPDLVILDEFQRFKNLLEPDPKEFAANMAHQLFGYVDPVTDRPTRTLLLSATPYRMYTTTDETKSDHYADFLETCKFLFSGSADRVEQLEHRFAKLRSALTSTDGLVEAGAVCREISAALGGVMARTERLAATPDRSGMLKEIVTEVSVEHDDLRSYIRLGNLAEAVEHHEPTEYWKSSPYLVNFMEDYKLKKGIKEAATDGKLDAGERLQPGPGLLDWPSLKAYELLDPQNGRLRWLLEDLDSHHAFELLWMPPSLRYYDTGSVYESPKAAAFTKRLIFSGWKVVPKAVSSLVSYEAERRAFAGRSHAYTTDFGRRGGQRLAFRTNARAKAEAEVRPGEVRGRRRAASMTAFLLVWPSPSLAELGDPRSLVGDQLKLEAVLAKIRDRVSAAVTPLLRTAPTKGVVDQRWYWAAPLFLDQKRHPAAVELLLAGGSAWGWEGDSVRDNFLAHLGAANSMLKYGLTALGKPPDDLVEVLAEVALGGPAQCAIRALRATVSLPIDHEAVVSNAARIAVAFRNFFNAPETTGIVVGARAEQADSEESVAGYWREVVKHSIDGNLQAVLDEHAHVMRDKLGYVSPDTTADRVAAAGEIGPKIAEALDLRTSTFRVDVPRHKGKRSNIAFDDYGMRTRFAVAFAKQKFDEGGEARIGSVLDAFNSPFWPFVLASTSLGQEGLDFHLWCHAVVHWNLPSNPVDLEQREGRVHRYKGHAVRRNIAATLGADALGSGLDPETDLWDELFDRAAATREPGDGEMVPYWVFHQGPAKIERHVPVLPFSRESARLPQLRKALAVYRLAFGQPRQKELVEFLGASSTDAELLELASQLRIDLTPPNPPAP